MMSVSKTLFIALSAILIFSSCNNYGKEYKLDKFHSVYYKGDGVDEATAKKLAEFLKEGSYFQEGKTAAVQIEKRKDTFDVNFVIDEKKLNATVETAFNAYGSFISKTVFNNAPTCVNLTNDQLEIVKKLGYTAPPVEEPAPAPAQ